MNKLLPVHRILLAIAGAGLVLVVVLYVVTDPADRETQRLQQEIHDSESALARMGVSASKEVLEGLLKQAEKREKACRKQDEEVLELVAATVLPVIQSRGWADLKDFVRQQPPPTRDMYMREFERIVRGSPMGNLDVPGNRLGLRLDTDSDRRYQLLLRLWSLEVILNQAHEHGLTLVWDETEEQPDARGSAADVRRRNRGNDAGTARQRIPAVMMLEPVELVLTSGKNSQPQLLRMAFRVGLAGTYGKLAAFMEAMGSRGTYFGVEAFEIRLLPPERGKEGRDGMLRLNVELVSFVPLNGKGSK